MNKKILATVSIIIILLMAYFVNMPHYEYGIGRDTHKAFGNAEYQILNSTSYDKTKQYNLYNFKYHEAIIDKLYEYVKKGDLIYFYGYKNGNVYIILDETCNKIVYCQLDGNISLIYIQKMIENNDIQLVEYSQLSKEQKEILNDLIDKYDKE